jgi:DNA helicase-2/ATP-dependent DNA helicase PcrA
MQTDSQEIKDNIINSIYQRIEPSMTQHSSRPEKIRILTFHSSKGLDGRIVFIPGLEETVFPNNKARQLPGKILECARLFYVAITRARAACFISYASSRNIQGRWGRTIPSRFCASTGAVFVQQVNSALTPDELQAINVSISNL